MRASFEFLTVIIAVVLPKVGTNMGFFHFDESLHPGGQFALEAFAYSEEPLDAIVREALYQSGLTPGVDEFKSGIRMDGNPKQAHALEDRGPAESTKAGGCLGSQTPNSLPPENPRRSSDSGPGDLRFTGMRPQ